jgi:hypothetical protein
MLRMRWVDGVDLATGLQLRLPAQTLNAGTETVPGQEVGPPIGFILQRTRYE